MPENSTNRGYPLPVAGDSFTPQAGVNALGVAVDADVQALADDVADASGIDDGAIGPAKLDRAYVVDGKKYVRAGAGAGTQATDNSQSVAIGYTAMRDVDGVSSVAIGYQSQLEASGSHSTAVGHQSQRTASGDYSVAVGYEAQILASGEQSIAIGSAAQQQASGDGAVAIGRSSQLVASGEKAIAIGEFAQQEASGATSVAVGANSQWASFLVQNGTELAGPLLAGRVYRIVGTNVLIDGVAFTASPPLHTGTGSETLITADAGTLTVRVLAVDADYHTVVGGIAMADYPGGIALGYNAYADTDRQVQIGTDVTYNGVQPPNALRVGVHDAVLTTDTPTTGEVLRFDGSAWVADGAATAAQGVKADNAAPLVNIGNLFPANVATGTDTLGNTTGFRSAGGGVIIASSTDQAWQGTRSLRAQAVGTGVQIVSVSTAATIAQSSGLLPVTPGETIHAEFRLYTSDTTSLWRVRAFAYSEAGALLSTVEGPLVTGAASWQICTADAVVPALSSLVLVTAYRVSGADGGVAYLDGFGCWRGAGGSWRPTGQDIADAGTRVKPTDASVVQLWNRSTSSWVDAAASSSVVYGTTAGTATEGNDTRVVNAVQNTRQVATGSGLTGGGDLTADRTLAVDFTAVATAAQGALAEKVEIGVACSDETTDLATGTAKVTFRLPHAMTLTAVRASVTTAPAGSALTVDINAGGASVLSTLLTIDAGEKTSTTAATPAVIGTSALADDAEITVDIDAVGSSTAGAGLKVWLIGTRA